MSNLNCIDVLLVEDDLGDVELTRKSLSKSKLNIQLSHVEDGVECMSYLRRVGRYEAVTKPDLILLDLNMPRKDGRQVLEEMKSDAFLRRIPTVVLTTSSADADVIATYDIGANCYITKPVDFLQFQKVVNEIADFWFTIVKLPDKEEAE